LIRRIGGRIKRRSWSRRPAFKIEEMAHRIRTPATLPASLTQSRLNCFHGMGQTQLQQADKFPIAIGAMRHQIQACCDPRWQADPHGVRLRPRAPQKTFATAVRGNAASLRSPGAFHNSEDDQPLASHRQTAAPGTDQLSGLSVGRHTQSGPNNHWSGSERARSNGPAPPLLVPDPAPRQAGVPGTLAQMPAVRQWDRCARPSFAADRLCNSGEALH
jgi:hypothetical protein